MANGLARIEQGIALLNEAKRAIASAAPIQELKQIRDQSEALRSLAKKAGLQLMELRDACSRKNIMQLSREKRRVSTKAIIRLSFLLQL